MRRFYQESWHGIPFTAIGHTSFFGLADSKFYSTFYEELFRRNKSWDVLSAAWRRSKQLDAEWLASQIRKILPLHPERTCRVLSIGSGVGFMEKCLLQECPQIELYVNEPSTVSMKWLREILPASRIFIGTPTIAIPSDLEFDVVYLSAVDYGIPTPQLANLLDFLQAQLTPHGLLLCISASLLEEDSFVGALVNGMKIVIRGFLHYMGIRRQQFWGWRRTRGEYQNLFSEAGFSDISDGFLDDGFNSYWIRGSKSSDRSNE